MVALNASSRETVVGLALGVSGVVLLAGFDPARMHPGAFLAVMVALGAALSYAIASTYTKAAREVDASSNAHGSMWAALMFILAAVPFFPANAPADVHVIG
ncbi:MAG: EamA/RhaT family transporter, partial [Betaproteobacteria bacterium]